MIIDKLIGFFADYLKGKPITDVLLIVLIGVFVWNESSHTDRTNKAHTVLHDILEERDANEQKRNEANERNTDRIISALTGVRKEVQRTTAEVQKIPEATAAAADKIVGGSTDGK